MTSKIKICILPVAALFLLILSCGLSSGGSTPHFIAVGMSGRVYLSPDGDEWSDDTGPATVNNLYSVAYGGEVIVVVGDGPVVYWSTNGED